MNVSIFVGIGRRIILKLVLQKWDGMDWIYLVQDASQWWVLMNMVMNLQVP
jgi:hypothetical protein